MLKKSYFPKVVFFLHFELSGVLCCYADWTASRHVTRAAPAQLRRGGGRRTSLRGSSAVWGTLSLPAFQHQPSREDVSPPQHFQGDLAATSRQAAKGTHQEASEN